MSAAHAALLFANAAVFVVAGRMLPAGDYGRFMVAFLMLSWINCVVGSTILPGLKKIVSEDAGR